MEPTVGRVVLSGFAVGPDEEESAGGNDRAGREDRGGAVGEVVGEEIAGEIRRRGSRVVEFDPVIEVAVGGVGDAGGVLGEELVDHDLDDRDEGIVGGTGCGDVERAPAVGIAVGDGAEASARGQGVVLEPVEDGGGRGASLRAGEDDDS